MVTRILQDIRWLKKPIRERIKHDRKQLTESRLTDKILEDYFRKHYGLEYNSLRELLNLSYYPNSPKLLTSEVYYNVSRKPNNLLLFPLTGSYWNYLITTCMISELKKHNLDNGAKTKPLIISQFEDINTIKKQLERFKKDNDGRDFTNATVFDFISTGKTYGKIKAVIPGATLVKTQEHQKMMISDFDFTGPKRYITKYDKNDVLQEKLQLKSETELDRKKFYLIMPMLIDFGRLSMRMHLQDKGLI